MFILAIPSATVSVPSLLCETIADSTQPNAQVQLMMRARAGASFQSKGLTYLIYGGEAAIRRREAALARVNSSIGSYDQMALPEAYTGSDREEQYRYGLKWARPLMEEATRHANEIFTFETHENSLINASPFGLHTGMFIPTIRFQGSVEQQKQWLPLAESGKIIGTYAQTELGHGGFVRGLETTATIDTKTDQFIIHSPTVTSTKCWPGGLGLSVSHAIVIARLIVDTKDHGSHSFIVPLRSLTSWKPLPGIELGDLGLKPGLNGTDNGYATFHSVRIPRSNMLMGLAQVTRHGSYSRKGKAQAAYSTMVLGRVNIIRNVAFQLAQATTIATRYSTVRTQGYGQYNEAHTELPLMSYRSQNARLLGLNAQAFALLFASKTCMTIYRECKDATSYLHALVAGLKAYATRTAADGAEDARKCCGGQGYSNLSGLPEIVSLVTPQCTWEGDNMVMYQQTARFLMASLRSVEGRKLHPSLSYIVDPAYFSTLPGVKRAANAPTLHLPETHLALFRQRAARIIRSTSTAFAQTSATEGVPTAWNKHMLRLIEAAKAHTEVFVLESYISHVAAIDDTAVRLVMQKNCALYALTSILSSPAFFEHGFLSHDEAEVMRNLVDDLLDKLLPDAIALTDSWGFSDRSLKSAIGMWDGNVYETFMSWTRQLPINRNLHNEDGGAAGAAWREVIGPMLKEARSMPAEPASEERIRSML